MTLRQYIFIPLWLLSSALQAQEELLELGTAQDPPGISWCEIKTPHFQIVFPQEIEADAQRTANLLEHVYEADCTTLGVKPGRLPLLLHNRNTISNGFYTLAPHRSEWYNTPPQAGLTGPVNWYPLLAIHEYRHVVQFQAMKQGFNKLLYYALGEIGWMAGAAVSVPAWFFEGDAVVMETALTRGGRGRQPEFHMPIRAMLLSGKPYSYYKMTLGSYKNWINDPYSYGFVLNTWMRRQYGTDFWRKTLKSTAKFSFIPYRFSWSIRERTGKGCIKSHGAALQELQTHYRNQMPPPDSSNVKRWSRENDGFLTVYQAPRFSGDSTVIALKYGLADQKTFVAIKPDGSEKVLWRPNEIDGSPHSLSGEVLVWAETVYDARWGNQDFHAIKQFDLSHGTLRTLVKKCRYFAPALSPDGRSIAAVLFESDNRCCMLVLDSETGEEIRRFDNRENAFLMTPGWSPDGQQIVCNRLTSSGRSLAILDVQNGITTDLIPAGASTMSTPVHCGKYILFSSNDGDTEQIFAVECTSGSLYRVTARPFGAFYPAVSADGKRLLFNDFDNEGYHVAEMALDPARWMPIAQLPVLGNPWFDPITTQEAGADLLKDPPQVTYPVSTFSPWRDLVRIHSWQITSDEITRTFGGRIYSQNLLGTLQTSFGYDFDRDEETGAGSANLTLAKFYPLIDAGIVYGHRASSYLDSKDSVQRYTWREKSGYAAIRLPLNLNRNGYAIGLTLQSSARLTWISDLSDDRAFEPWENQNGWWKSMSYSLTYYRYRRSAADIFPVQGHTLHAGFDHTPWESRYSGKRYYLSASLYLPGLVERHGLALRADYEIQNPVNYRYSSAIRFPRGYSYRYRDKIGRIGLDYTLPLAYPDQHLWALLYVQRLKSLFFHDYGWSRFEGKKNVYQASGVELTADVNFLSLPVIIDMGVRISWRWREKNWRTEAIIGLPI